jgi:predicted HD phosphohydrolase
MLIGLQILDCAFLRETDPEGFANLVENIDQFSKKYLEYAFDIMYRKEYQIWVILLNKSMMDTLI